jgi:inorganic pyrophosphatase
MRVRSVIAVLAVPCALAAQTPGDVPAALPGAAVDALARSLDAAAAHGRHVWRDTPPIHDGRLVQAYVEISRGDRRKWEFDMRANARAIDRIMPEDPGGYPVNYGFVPQTVSYDGDPFDALVLGPPLSAGEVVRGIVMGIMHMEDEKGLDSKVVLSPVGKDGGPAHGLTAGEQARIAEYFRRYKQHEPGKFSRVPGWGPPSEALAYVRVTHGFFVSCRGVTGSCRP